MPPAPLTQKRLDELLGYLADQDDFVFLETTRISAEEHRSWLFLHPIDRLTLKVGDDPDRFFDQAQAFMAQGYYLAGWLAYELGYLLEPVLARDYQAQPNTTLAELGVYGPPHIYDHRTDSFSGAGPWPVRETPPPAQAAGHRTANLRLSEDKERYLAKIARIKAYIEQGDTYQVNYTLKYHFDLEGSPIDLYQTLRRSQSVYYAALIRQGDRRILSFSPELFFRKQAELCTVRPMKGTIGRGLTHAQDTAAASFLGHDLKNRSENIMIVDLLRNDLGRLCQPGRVRTPTLFAVEAYETVHQMTSTVEGDLRPDIRPRELFRALFPCGSVTGAPKIRTMQIIRELENGPRGVYTGAIGFLGPQGDGLFNVPIRTLVLEGRQGEMGIGSGIVYDSDPEKEWEECCLKGRFLTEPRPDFQLIETLLWQAGKGYWLLDLHLRRLERSAAQLGFTNDPGQVDAALETAAACGADSGHSACRVRLLLAKDGTIGQESTPCPSPGLISPPKAFPDAAEAPTIRLSTQAIDRGSPYLYHKTTLRALYEQERAKAAAAGCLEVIFANQRGEITEGSFTNIFVHRGDQLLTPPLNCGLLGGVFREYLLTTFPERVREAVLSPMDLKNSAGIYVGNSIRGLIPVRLI